MPQPICVKTSQGRRDPPHAPSTLAVALVTALAALPDTSLAQEITPVGSSGGTPPAMRTTPEAREPDSVAIELQTVSSMPTWFTAPLPRMRIFAELGSPP